MRGAVLPSALLDVALGLILALAPRRVCWYGLGTFVGVSLSCFFVPLPRLGQEQTLLGCWISVIATASAIYLVRELRLRAALTLSINAGFWSASTIAFTESPLAVFVGFSAALVAVLAGCFAKWWRARIVLKIVASWLIAVAALVSLLQFLPVTPGYLPDHLE